MNILYISKAALDVAGGAELRTDMISRELSKQDNVYVLCGKTDPNLPKREKKGSRNIRYIKCCPDLLFDYGSLGFFVSRYLFAFISFPFVFFAIYKNEIDVVIESASPYPSLSILWKYIFNIRYVIVQHGFFDKSFYENYDYLTVTIQLLVQNFLWIFHYDGIIVPSNEEYKKLKNYGVCERKLHVVHNGINSEKYNATKPISKRKYGLVCVGRVTPTKGQTKIIDAHKKILKSGENIHLHIVGDGGGIKQAIKHCKDLGTIEETTFHGYVSEEKKSELLSNSKIFVYGSEYESFGIVLLEAMASGLPIVATYQDAYDDFFTHERNGFLIKNGSSEMATHITKLLNNEKMSQKISENNKKDSSKYTWESAAEKTRKIIKNEI